MSSLSHCRKRHLTISVLSIVRPASEGHVQVNDERQPGREQLLELIRGQAAATDCWKRAETVVLADMLRERFDAIGVRVTPDIAASLMAAAMLLASTSDEWGGDYRDALADLAAVGLELFES